MHKNTFSLFILFISICHDNGVVQHQLQKNIYKRNIYKQCWEINMLDNNKSLKNSHFTKNVYCGYKS